MLELSHHWPAEGRYFYTLQILNIISWIVGQEHMKASKCSFVMYLFHVKFTCQFNINTLHFSNSIWSACLNFKLLVLTATCATKAIWYQVLLSMSPPFTVWFMMDATSSIGKWFWTLWQDRIYQLNTSLLSPAFNQEPNIMSGDVRLNASSNLLLELINDASCMAVYIHTTFQSS